MKTELNKFYGLIDQIKIAMMTTRHPDGISNRGRWPIRNAPTALISGL